MLQATLLRASTLLLLRAPTADSPTASHHRSSTDPMDSRPRATDSSLHTSSHLSSMAAPPRMASVPRRLLPPAAMDPTVPPCPASGFQSGLSSTSAGTTPRRAAGPCGMLLSKFPLSLRMATILPPPAPEVSTLAMVALLPTAPPLVLVLPLPTVHLLPTTDTPRLLPRATALPLALLTARTTAARRATRRRRRRRTTAQET